MHCRFCGHEGLHKILDLGNQPPANSFLTSDDLNKPEKTYPLEVYVCDTCYLVQLGERSVIDEKEIFNSGYVYYSSQSPANVSHAKEFVDTLIERFGYNDDTRFMEIASNDGYLLQHVVKKKITCVGVEPSKGPAKEAMRKGIPTLEWFWTKEVGQRFDDYRMDYIVGINVLAHVPDINDFVAGLKLALAEDGVISFEFPHVMNLIDEGLFDTIYHEHYSYFSFHTVCEIFSRHGLEVFDVEQIPEHGGSLRIYAGHPDKHIMGIRQGQLFIDELRKGMMTVGYYGGLQDKADDILEAFNDWLSEVEIVETKRVVVYGAAAKGNTIINSLQIKDDEQIIEYAVDCSPHKQGLYLPGSHIPVVSEDKIRETKPDYVLILAWNLKDEIMKQLTYIREWGGKFVVAIPELEII